MREENNKQVPLVIDVDPHELIAVENDIDKTMNEMDFDFELREPNEPNNSENHARKMNVQQDNEAEYIEEKVEVEEYSKEIENNAKEYKRFTRKQQTKTSTGAKKDEDTSFRAFKNKQYENERQWRKKAGSSMKRFIGIVLLILIGVPLFLGISGTTIFIGGMGIFFGVMFLGLGILGVGAAAFLTSTNAGAIASVAGFGSLLLIGVSGLGLLILGRVLVWLKDQLVVVYKKARRRREGQEDEII